MRIERNKGTRSKIDKWIKEHDSTLREIQFTFSLIKKSPLTMLGFSIVLLLFLVAIFAPLIAPYSPIEVNLKDKLLPPSAAHFFGTDDMGKDIFSRVLYGAGISIRIGITVIIVAVSIGTSLGAIAGFFGGFIDDLIMRINDIFQAFPSIILAIVVAAAIGRGITKSMFAIAFCWWPWYARLVRGKTLSIRKEQYVEAAKAAGATNFRIIIRHVLPNCIAPIIVTASMDIGNAILTAATLGFLGLGASPPMPEWGLMASIGRMYMRERWWMVVFPSIAIFITVLGFNLIGDGLRDILDPRLRR